MRIITVPDKNNKLWDIKVSDVDWNDLYKREWYIDSSTYKIEGYLTGEHGVTPVVKQRGSASYNFPMHIHIHRRTLEDNDLPYIKQERIQRIAGWDDHRRESMWISRDGALISLDGLSHVSRTKVQDPNEPNLLQIKLVEHYACRIAILHEEGKFNECIELVEKAEDIHPDLIYNILHDQISWK